MNRVDEPIPIVIIDDDKELCNTLARLFEREGRIRVLETSDLPHDTIPLLEKHRPKVLLLDIEFDGQMKGIDIIRMIRERDDIDVKILVYTIFATHEVIFEAMQAGANSYVWKDEPTERISESVINTAQGRAQISPTIARMILDRFDRYRQSLTSGQKQFLEKNLE
jgi:two-component system response regulator DegU